MKLTDPEIIREGEKDLIEAIKNDLDLDSIHEIVKDKLKVNNLESRGGRIVIHNNKIAFKIEFELNLSGSLMFDRDGNYIPDDDLSPDDRAGDHATASSPEKTKGSLNEPDLEIVKDNADDKAGEKDDTEEDSDESDDKEDAAAENDFSDNVHDIAQDLVAEDVQEAADMESDVREEESDDIILDESDSSASSELDLDVENYGDMDDSAEDIDFSDDEDIDDILKESRDFWEKNK